MGCSLLTDFRALSPTNALCTPVSGYFDSVSTVSSRCPVGCTNCVSQTLCTSCASNYFLQSDRLCYASCPLRFFSEPRTLTCLRCPFDCFTCDRNGRCLTCNATTDFRRLNPSTQRCVSL
mgnify:CR=1 FL=1